MKKRIRQSTILIFSVLAISAFILFAQTDEIKPVTVEKPMPDFSLPVFQGGEMTLSEIEGKNIPTVYIVDKNGILQFKYLSQNTFDRPGPAYLLKVLDVINSSE